MREPVQVRPGGNGLTVSAHMLREVTGQERLGLRVQPGAVVRECFVVQTTSKSISFDLAEPSSLSQCAEHTVLTSVNPRRPRPHNSEHVAQRGIAARGSLSQRSTRRSARSSDSLDAASRRSSVAASPVNSPRTRPTPISSSPSETGLRSTKRSGSRSCRGIKPISPSWRRRCLRSNRRRLAWRTPSRRLRSRTRWRVRCPRSSGNRRSSTDSRARGARREKTRLTGATDQSDRRTPRTGAYVGGRLGAVLSCEAPALECTRRRGGGRSPCADGCAALGRSISRVATELATSTSELGPTGTADLPPRAEEL